jgi:histidine ammonia-lyase
MRSLLEDSEIQNAHVDCGKVQDPYSLRCQPQVMGAILSYLKDSKTHLMEEANAVSDNPLVFANSHDVISGGNFHAEIVGFSADILGMIGAEIGAISERRVAHLMDSHMSGLPPFLVKKPGLNSGFMMAQVTAAALASENKVYAHPASVDSLPTSANQEDHVSMAPFAGMKLLKIAKNVHAILMIEILAACQGIDLRKPLRPAKKLQKYMDKIRAHIPFYEKDGYLGHDFELALVITTQDEFDGDIDDAFFKENS